MCGTWSPLHRLLPITLAKKEALDELGAGLSQLAIRPASPSSSKEGKEADDTSRVQPSPGPNTFGPDSTIMVDDTASKLAANEENLLLLNSYDPLNKHIDFKHDDTLLQLARYLQFLTTHPALTDARKNVSKLMARVPFSLFRQVLNNIPHP
mmetsp:Transcript_8521/g.21184  ORF Transcript_8521/g.21184 Transcript_8521/m.21184 type:complete len:152 (-) Transcript_8521:39-494(-)